MATVQLDDLLEEGFITQEEYDRRKKELLETPLEQNPGIFAVALAPVSNPLAATASNKAFVGVNEYDVKPKKRRVEQFYWRSARKRMVRLFVSSTFLDMKEERSILVQQVFPKIKEFCRTRGVNFTYVDFRWGITAEESAGGRVLERCLDDIDRCRPYMIGILGERYGWAKGELQDRVLEQTFRNAIQRYPWVEKYTDRSITELEMLHGALFYPELSKGCSFYFRDPQQAQRKGLSKSESKSSQLKLDDLKGRIRGSGLPHRDYTSVQSFAENVLADLTKAIERDFPLQEKEFADVITKEEHLFNAFAEEKCDIFVGRESQLQYLNNYASSDSRIPLVILGPNGIGKTSLICKWATENNKSVSSSPSSTLSSAQKKPFVVIPLYFGVIHGQPHKLMFYLLNLLERKFKIGGDIPTEPSSLLHSLSEWLTLVAAKHMKTNVVIVFEGMDSVQIEGFSWIPTTFPPNVKLIFTCTNESSLFSHLVSECKTLNVENLVDKDRRQLIEEFLGRFSKQLSHSQTQHLIEFPASGNPLFLRSILQQLVMYAEFDYLVQYMDKFLKAKSIVNLFEIILSELERECSPKEFPTFVQDVMCLLAVSRYGLTESEIVSMLKVYQQMTWSSLMSSLGELVSQQNGVIKFSSVQLKETVKKRYLLDQNEKAKLYHRKIADFFAEKALSERKLHEYPWHLTKLDSKKELELFLASSIDVLKELYTPLSKYDFFGYWKATGSDNAVSQYSQKLTSSSIPNKKVLGSLQVTLANFIVESGKSASQAIPLLSSALSIYEKEFGEFSENVADVCYDFAMLYVQSAQFPEATAMADRCLKIRTKLYGKIHPKISECIWSKAVIKKKESNYDEAIELYEKALGIAVEHYGSNHPQCALYMKTIADVYRLQSTYDKAERLYLQALHINRDNFGSVHPSIAECLDCLGRIYKKKGLYTQAKDNYKEALHIQEQIFGAEHICVAETCMNLGDVERKLNNLTVAEDLYKKALSINTKNLGAIHPEVAENYNALGILYKVTGRYTEGIQAVEKAVDIIHKVHGPDHVKLARFMNNLADIHAILAQYTKAKQLYLKAYVINKTKLGVDHPEVSENLNAIGKIEKKRGNYEEARTCYERSLDIVLKVYGSEHPKVAIYSHDLGVIFRKLKQYDKSWQFYIQSKELNEKLFGPTSPDVAMNLNGLGMLLKAKGEDLDQAARYHEEALSIFDRAYGKHHEKYALTLNLLAEVHRKEGKLTYDGAEKLYLEALEINKEIFGEKHPEVAENLNGLAQVYKGQLNYLKAEPVLKQAIEMTENTIGKTHPHTINRYRNLADLYERAGKVEDSKAIWKIVEDLKNMRALEEAVMKKEGSVNI